MPSSSTLFIVNPAAASGKSKKKWEDSYSAIRSHLGPVESVITSNPGHATFITKDAIQSGYERIIGFGGDGTFNEIINGYFENLTPINANAKVGMLIQGTGRDLSRSLNLSRDLNTALQKIKRDQSRKLDIGYVRYSDSKEFSKERLFANITSFGLGGEVDWLMKKSFQKLGLNGSFAYFMAILTSLATYNLKHVHLVVDNYITWKGNIRNIAIANGRYFGGGLQIAPSALINDGLLDVIIIGDVNINYLIRHAHYFYRGKHPDLNGIYYFKGKEITAYGNKTLKMDIDGEPIGSLPATFSVLPNSLNMLY